MSGKGSRTESREDAEGMPDVIVLIGIYRGWDGEGRS